MFRLLSAVAILTLAAVTAAAAEGAFSIISDSSNGGAAVQGISADGSVVTGVSDGRVFRWTADLGLTYISPRDFLHTFFATVSSDGSTIVSTVADSAGTFSAARWTEQQAAWQTLGGLPGQGSPDGTQISTGWGVSGDGATVVGLGWHSNYTAEAFQWTEEAGMVGLGQPPASTKSS